MKPRTSANPKVAIRHATAVNDRRARLEYSATLSPLDKMRDNRDRLELSDVLRKWESVAGAAFQRRSA